MTVVTRLNMHACGDQIEHVVSVRNKEQMVDGLMSYSIIILDQTVSALFGHIFGCAYK